MICMARIDDRLIHGQVAVKWSKELNVSRIIVASDAVAGNKIQVSALKMAAPAGVKAAILTCDKAVVRDIAGLGIEVIHQPLPSDSRKGLLELIDAAK